MASAEHWNAKDYRLQVIIPEATLMNRKTTSLLMVLIGTAVFVLSVIFLLPIADLYLPSLVLMFVAVVVIGVGGAVLKGFDRHLDQAASECYYCKGTGRITEPTGKEVCPRCGGTGLARPDDFEDSKKT